MTGVVVTFFVLAAFFVNLGCVDQRRLYWRLSAWRYRAPEANEPSEAASRVGRFAAFPVVAVMSFSACSAMDFADNDSSSHDEVRAVAVESIEGETHPSSEGSTSMARDALRDAAEGEEGPYHRLDVTPEGQDSFEVATDTGEYPFCMSMTSERSGGFAVPGADGPSTVLPQHDLVVSVDEGNC